MEDIRVSVLSSNRKMRMNEIEGLTNSLTEIGRTAAILKSLSFFYTLAVNCDSSELEWGMH